MWIMNNYFLNFRVDGRTFRLLGFTDEKFEIRFFVQKRQIILHKINVFKNIEIFLKGIFVF